MAFKRATSTTQNVLQLSNSFDIIYISTIIEVQNTVLSYLSIENLTTNGFTIGVQMIISVNIISEMCVRSDR